MANDAQIELYGNNLDAAWFEGKSLKVLVGDEGGVGGGGMEIIHPNGETTGMGWDKNLK